ncbi:MAG: hypothetical protein IPI00_06555 [Flavobacteriales bacterium]|nr:hypothetical protein [Flavobacteriales bacterium]
MSTINVLAGEIYILYIDNFSSNGQAFDLGWNLTNGASLDCTVLPVDLLRCARQTNKGIRRIELGYGFETNTSHFIVERSMDAIHSTVLAACLPLERPSL